jgi:hypothetical protein
MAETGDFCFTHGVGLLSGRRCKAVQGFDRGGMKIKIDAPGDTDRRSILTLASTHLGLRSRSMRLKSKGSSCHERRPCLTHWPDLASSLSPT